MTSLFVAPGSGRGAANLAAAAVKKGGVAAMVGASGVNVGSKVRFTMDADKKPDVPVFNHRNPKEWLNRRARYNKLD